MKSLNLQARMNGGGCVVLKPDGGWKLSLPAGKAGEYRLGQVDDYSMRRRDDFLWTAPLRLEVYARVSDNDLPGTWGFGLWNDPFSVSLGLKGAARRIPALPNTAWFFHASKPNYLALHDDHAVRGMLAATFRSVQLPALVLAGGLAGLPLLGIPAGARLLRRTAGKLVKESGTALELDATAWHTYALEWEEAEVRFWLDGKLCHETQVSPRGRLGLVIWMDNQYMAFPPDGVLRAGTLANPESWLELGTVQLG